MSGDDAHAKRIEDAYTNYASDPRFRSRWDAGNPGNQAILAERLEAIRSALKGCDLWPPASFPILDVGCGTGEELERFVEWGADPKDLLGVDLLPERLKVAHERFPHLRFVRSDASRLDLDDSSFRLVVISTLFSSILDQGTARRVAGEIDRVLVGGGCVLWYDVRLPNPWNRNTTAVSKRSIVRLFPGYEIHLRTATVIPQIARRMPASAYPELRRFPFLRSHLIGTLRKPARSS